MSDPSVDSRASEGGRPVEEELRVRLSVPDMDCPSCAGKVDAALDGVSGVREVETLPATGTVVATLEPGADRATVVEAVESAGYEVVGEEAGEGPTDETGVPGDERSVWWSSRAKKTWVGGTFLAVGLALEFPLAGLDPVVATVLGREFSLAAVLFLAAVGISGQGILRGGYYSARNLSLDIDFLMSAAILAAIVASLVSGGETELYLEAATLAVLFSVAELLERYAMDQARTSLRELMELSPDEATVRRDGEEVVVPVEELSVGDVVVVRPGEEIPADGDVLEGTSAVDEAAITGESVPADKTPGDAVYAGTMNEEGYLEVSVTAPPGEDTLSRIVELVEDAQANRTEREQFVDRFAGYYTPVMVALAILVAVVPPVVLSSPVSVGLAGYGVTFQPDWQTWFVNGITMLVLACPCAFVISTPVTVVSGITAAARNGVLVKGGNHLEAMGEIDAVALDKTGTLTRGELTVTDVVALSGNTEGDVLRCARGVERRSEHPIAEAIVGETSGDLPQVTEFRSITGKGVTATLDGTPHYAGKPGLFEELGFDLSHAHVVEDTGDGVGAEVRSICERNDCLNLADDTIPRLQSEGKTVVLVGRVPERPDRFEGGDGAGGDAAGRTTASRYADAVPENYELEGIVAVADEIRPGARWMVERLRELGVTTVMLTGDNERTARAVAAEVGVDDYRAELLPEEKVDAIERLLEEYGDVAMVGDGVNDAPALATATVGIAMGAAGTDTAIETADVALLGDDLAALPYLQELARSANGVIRQNVWASLAAKAVLAVGVPLGVVGVATAVLVGDAGMTVGVTGNAMRLSRITPRDLEDD